MPIPYKKLVAKALEYLPTSPIKPTSTWVGIVVHTVQDLEDIKSKYAFLWLKCHPRITVRTIKHEYFARHPLEAFELRFIPGDLMESVQVKQLRASNPVSGNVVILRAVEIEDADEDEEEEEEAADVEGETEGKEQLATESSGDGLSEHHQLTPSGDIKVDNEPELQSLEGGVTANKLEIDTSMEDAVSSKEEDEAADVAGEIEGEEQLSTEYSGDGLSEPHQLTPNDDFEVDEEPGPQNHEDGVAARESETDTTMEDAVVNNDDEAEDSDNIEQEAEQEFPNMQSGDPDIEDAHDSTMQELPNAAASNAHEGEDSNLEGPEDGQELEDAQLNDADVQNDYDTAMQEFTDPTITNEYEARDSDSFGQDAEHDLQNTPVVDMDSQDTQDTHFPELLDWFASQHEA